METHIECFKKDSWHCMSLDEKWGHTSAGGCSIAESGKAKLDSDPVFSCCEGQWVEAAKVAALCCQFLRVRTFKTHLKWIHRNSAEKHRYQLLCCSRYQQIWWCCWQSKWRAGIPCILWMNAVHVFPRSLSREHQTACWTALGWRPFLDILIVVIVKKL